MSALDSYIKHVVVPLLPEEIPLSKSAIRPKVFHRMSANYPLYHIQCVTRMGNDAILTLAPKGWYGTDYYHNKKRITYLAPTIPFLRRLSKVWSEQEQVLKIFPLPSPLPLDRPLVSHEELKDLKDVAAYYDADTHSIWIYSEQDSKLLLQFIKSLCCVYKGVHMYVPALIEELIADIMLPCTDRSLKRAYEQCVGESEKPEHFWEDLLHLLFMRAHIHTRVDHGLVKCATMTGDCPLLPTKKECEADTKKTKELMDRVYSFTRGKAVLKHLILSFCDQDAAIWKAVKKHTLTLREQGY